MCYSTTECFVVYVFANGCFYEVRPCQVNGTCSFHHDGFITHDRQIGTTCHTSAHNCRDLDDAFGAHLRVVVKDATKMIFVWKYFILHRKKYTSTVYEINNR